MSDESDVIQAIRDVVEHAAEGRDKERRPQYLTAYQILDRLPKAMRTEFINTYGKSGAGAGDWSSAAKHIALLLQGMGGIDVEYLDTRGIEFRVADEEVEAGYQVCGIYRLTRT